MFNFDCGNSQYQSLSGVNTVTTKCLVQNNVVQNFVQNILFKNLDVINRIKGGSCDKDPQLIKLSNALKLLIKSGCNVLDFSNIEFKKNVTKMLKNI